MKTGPRLPSSIATRRLDGPVAVSGRRFVEAALVDIKARTARGEKVRVVFDIDDTLSESRARTLHIAKAWDRKNGTSFFSKLTLETVQSSGLDTAKAMRLPRVVAEAFDRHWNVEFWKGESFKHDTPIAPMVQLVKRAKAAGAEVVFLTGRIEALEEATVKQLRRFGLEADRNSVVSKADLSVRTAPFKTQWLEESAKAGYRLGFFLTESRRDVSAVQKWSSEAAAVLLDSPFSGTEEVDAKTPRYQL